MSEKLIVLRNFLYRFFAIGIVLSILSQAILVIFSGMIFNPQPVFNTMPPFNAVPPFYGIPPQQIMITLMTFIGVSRIFLVYFVLCPALALHWTIKSENLK